MARTLSERAVAWRTLPTKRAPRESGYEARRQGTAVRPEAAVTETPTPTSTLKRVFFGQEGLRGGWRFVGFYLLLIVATAIGAGLSALVFMALKAVHLRLPNTSFLVMGTVVYLPAFVVVFGLPLLDRGGLRSGGVGGPALRSLSELVGGAVMGLVLVLLALILPALLGHVAIHPVAPSQAWLTLPVWFVGLLVAAAWEEIAFRGYGFQWLCRSTGNVLARAIAPVAPLNPQVPAQWLARAGGVTVGAAAFGAMHMGNPGADVVSTLNTMLAGVWLAVAVFRARSLWLAVGMHFGWNFSLGPVLGTPISGLGGADSHLSIPSLFQTSLDGPHWLTGGSYGLEASVSGTVVLFVAIAIAALWPRRPDADAAPVLRV